MPRGRPRSVPVPDFDSPPITDAEAARRGWYALYRSGPGAYSFCRPGQLPKGAEFKSWATDAKAAANACRQLERDELHGVANAKKRGGGHAA